MGRATIKTKNKIRMLSHNQAGKKEMIYSSCDSSVNGGEFFKDERFLSGKSTHLILNFSIKHPEFGKKTSAQYPVILAIKWPFFFELLHTLHIGTLFATIIS